MGDIKFPNQLRTKTMRRVSRMHRTVQPTMATYTQHTSIPTTEQRVTTMITEWEQRTGEVASPEFIASIAAQIS